MSGWANHIEIRQENGEYRATRTDDGMEIQIPSWPKPGADIEDWLSFMPLDSLEAFRQVYWDKWTWDSDKPEYRDMAALVESHIASRVAQLPASRVRTAGGLREQERQKNRRPSPEHLKQMQDRRNG